MYVLESYFSYISTFLIVNVLRTSILKMLGLYLYTVINNKTKRRFHCLNMVIIYRYSAHA